jgi:hypothetical protein
MLEKIQERVFPFIIALAALSVSASAAFYSVTGLSKLFAGASFEVMIMAGSLEAAKLVIASLLYQYRNTLPKVLKGYLMAACFVLILITSMGIYGFLSSAYQETANKSEGMEQELATLEELELEYQMDVERINGDIALSNEVISTQSKVKSTKIDYTDKDGNAKSYMSTVDSKNAKNIIDAERKNQIEFKVGKRIAQDSLKSIRAQIRNVKSNNDTAGELGPLKYLSGLTGWPMDKIINILLLTIIFVFDPLAIALVIAANYAFEQLKRKEEEEEDEDVDDHNLDLVLSDIVDSVYDDSEIQSILRTSVTLPNPPQPHLTEETGTEGISEPIEDPITSGVYANGYAVGIAVEEELPTKNYEVPDEPEEETIEIGEIEEFDDDGGVIIEDESEEDLLNQLKSIPKSHKYGPNGWKSISKKIEEIRNKKDDDLTIKY